MLPSNAVLEPIPAEDAGPYNPAIVTDLAGLLAILGEQTPELDVSRYSVVLSLAQLGMKFVGERHNNNVNARSIQLMLERYSAGAPGAVDYVVVLTDVEEEVDGEKVMVRKHMRARFPKPELPIVEPLPEGVVQEPQDMTDEELAASLRHVNEQALSDGPADEIAKMNADNDAMRGEGKMQEPGQQPNPDDAEPPKPGNAADEQKADGSDGKAKRNKR